MAVILKKNIVPNFPGDVQGGVGFMERVKSELGIVLGKDYNGVQLGLGFEAIIRYPNLDNLQIIRENLKPCEGYELSLHCPLNFENPENMSALTEKGFDNQENLECTAP